jgi:AraC family transcriptional regulator
VYENISVEVQAEVRVPVATAQLARFSLAGPADYIRCEQETYRLDLSLTPRPGNARACYREHWHPSRFEHVGSVCAMPPHEPLQTRTDCGSKQSSVVCYLRPEPMREWFDGDLDWNDRRLEAALDIKEPSVRDLLVRLAEELRHPGFAKEVLIGLIAGQLTVELGRYCTSIKAGPLQGGLAPWRLRLIDERLQEVCRPPTLPELAQLCGLSVRALTRGFRASRDISIGDYVARCQLDHAKALLAAGQSAKSIAHALGFASPSSFSYAFRKAAGEPPVQFRERMLRYSKR